MATSSSLALLLVLGFYAAAGTFADTYPVGSDQRWDVPSSGTNYTAWASRQTFVIGDSLQFNFNTGAHDVLQVSQSNYDSCNIQSPIAQYNNGPANVRLNNVGTFYYICGVGPHCSLGQKMAVTVSAANSTATPSSPPPTAGGPPLPSTAPPAVPSSPGPGSSGGGTPPNAAPTAGLGKAALATVALTASAAALLL